MIMRAMRLVFLMSVALAFAACSKHPGGTEPSGTASPSAAARPAGAAHGASATAAAAAQAAQTSKLNRDGSETVEEATGDSGVHNVLLAAVAST